MKLMRGDLFNIKADALVITTNGFVKHNGQAVMGRGCAKQLTHFYPNAPRHLGAAINASGNNVYVLPEKLHPQHGPAVTVVAFPVKPSALRMQQPTQVVKHMRARFKPNSVVPGWACIADAEIIQHSANQLKALADEHGWERVVMPRPGCGAGELNFEDINPLLQEILDDRFICVTY